MENLKEQIQELQKFAQMEKSEKEIVLEKAHNVSSKQEMQNLINSIGS